MARLGVHSSANLWACYFLFDVRWFADEAIASFSLDGVKFHPRYKEAVDGVVLISSDNVAFRVEDFFLKASRSVEIK
jgi:hypothetical protein